MTPSRIGLTGRSRSGVRPSIPRACSPTASTAPVDVLKAMRDGSLTTTPLPCAKTQVLAVPRSMARSLPSPANVMMIGARDGKTHSRARGESERCKALRKSEKWLLRAELQQSGTHYAPRPARTMLWLGWLLVLGAWSLVLGPWFLVRPRVLGP